MGVFTGKSATTQHGVRFGAIGHLTEIYCGLFEMCSLSDCFKSS